MKRFQSIVPSIVFVGLLINLSSVARATDFSWTNAAGGTFGTTGNWDPAGPPTTTNDTATFGLGGSYTVAFGANATSGRLTFTNSNAVTFDLLGRTYSLGTGADRTLVVSNTASLIISSSAGGGSLTANAGGGFNSAIIVRPGASLSINNSLGSPVSVISQAGADVAGSFTVHGAGTVYNNNVPGVFWTLRNGSTFNVMGGATGTVQNFNVELTGAAVTTTTIDGAGTVLNSIGLARVIPDAGTIHITGGATWNSGSTFEMGVFFSTGGRVNVGNGVGTSRLIAPNLLFGTTFDPGRSFPEMHINSGGIARATATNNSVFVYDRGTMTLRGGAAEIVQNGSLKVADINNDNNQEGLLRGSGTIRRIVGGSSKFTIINDGKVRPGDTNATPIIGTISIFDGDLVQNSGGTTFYNFTGGNSADLISITGGNANIGGTNNFTILNGYIPQVGDRWDFVVADDITYTAKDNMLALMTSFGLQNDYTFGVVASNGQEALMLFIPEPNIMGLLGVGGLFFLLRRKRIVE